MIILIKAYPLSRGKTLKLNNDNEISTCDQKQLLVKKIWQ